jgi:hypothetical protein
MCRQATALVRKPRPRGNLVDELGAALEAETFKQSAQRVGAALIAVEQITVRVFALRRVACRKSNFDLP